jgi:pimeloyl-ACP methyl ester carboxylesterase
MSGPVDLYHRRLGAGRPVVILHGLLGSSDNWGTVGRDLSSSYDVLLVDQRDHGRSPHTDRITYPLMADDVHALITRLGLKDLVMVGHSMGGKTAMFFAQKYPDLVRHQVIVDMGPREYPFSNHERIIQGLQEIDLKPLRSRQEVEQRLAQYVKEPGVVQFLMKSLYWKEEGQLAWRFNVPLIARDMPDILAAIGPETVRTPTLFIRGGQSDYITREDIPAMKEQFTNVRIETVDYAGHWVHAQAPEEVARLIREVA